VFVDRFLLPFLERCAASTAYLSTLDGDSETGTTTDDDDDDDDNDY
jgi:hypothetical protein